MIAFHRSATASQSNNYRVSETLRSLHQSFDNVGVIYCSPVMAQEQNAWKLGTVLANSSVARPDDQQVYEILLKMLDRWNAQDIEGYLEVYWKSPELLVVVDSEQFNGWQQLHDSYLNGISKSHCDGVHSTQRNPSQAPETGSRISSHLVVGLFPKFQAAGGGRQHYERPKV
jgi:hypothetical protein